MITKKMLKLYSYLVISGELFTLTCATPFTWNRRRGKLELTSGTTYFLFNIFCTVCFLIVLLITFRIGSALYRDYFDRFGLLMYICFACILWSVLGLLVIIRKTRAEFADLVNHTIQLDKLLKRVFPEAVIYARQALPQKIQHAEHILKLIFIVHLIFYWLFGLSFYQRFDPFNRFFVQYFGIRPTWDNFMFLPLAIGEAWFTYIVGNNVAVILASLLFPLLMEFWFLSLDHLLPVTPPQSVAQGRDLDPLQGKAYLRFYRCQQIISQFTFVCCGSIYATVHHLALLIGHIAANYAVLSSTTSGLTRDVIVMKLGAVIMIPVAYLITYHEVTYLTRFSTATDAFLQKCRVHFAESRYLRRGFRSCRPIRMWTGYPFFCITSKRFFMLFVKLVVDQTITLLLTVGV